MKSPVRVQFWGTRGSLARPGQHTLRYGGNTSCVQVTSPNGTLLVIDCGTGAHDLGRSLLANSKAPLRGHILFSHTHWDHIQGFPFFAPLFVGGGQWDVYGPAGLGESLRDALAGQMQSTYFPVKLDDLGANIDYHDLVEGSFEIGDIRITARYLNHPALTLGYRLEMNGISVVYSCDHEPYSRTSEPHESISDLDQRHSDFLADADLVIHDSQFTDAEYASKRGWGHSPVEYVLEIARLGRVKHLALTHHDPMRTDDALDQIVESARADLKASDSLTKVFAAADRQVLELHACNAAKWKMPVDISSALLSVPQAMKDASLIIGVSDPVTSALLAEAARSEDLQTICVSDEASILKIVKSSSPAMIILEENPDGIDGLSVCKGLRANQDRRLGDVPIIVVSDREKTSEGKAAGVTGWLITPFSTQYAGAQIQSWLMRSVCRWVRATLPPDEDQRLASLRELSILDTPAEERFDRITRIAAALTNVPFCLISLLDLNRQWFKSCYGGDWTETSREFSFCSHVVSNRKSVIVADTYLDDRFADNPLVTGEAHVRFYAGFPIFHDDGSCLGTLCLVDIRPRILTAETIRLLEDLVSLAQQEINSSPRRAGV